MKMSLLALFSALVLPAAASMAAEGEQWVYVGTYTGGQSKSKGIHLFKLDVATGKLTPAGVAAEAKSPSFLTIHPSKKFLYAVGEGNDKNNISAFSINPTDGKLTLLNQKYSGGAGPCHISVTPDGKVALAANYGGGSVCSIPINPDGSLADGGSSIKHTGSSVNPNRQKESHAHSFNPDPTGKWAYAADLGLDKVLIYKIGGDGTLTANDPAHAAVAPGSGPRHFAFHPSGKYAYVINELDMTMTAFAHDAATGALKTVGTWPTLPEGAERKGASTAEVVVHPSGKFVYGSNRGHHSIAIFKADESTGQLTPAGHANIRGRTPRNFNIDPTGNWLIAAGQDSDTLAVFKIDPQSGALTPVGDPVECPKPVCVKFLPIP
jgi:6-phosphogluconolactonase